VAAVVAPEPVEDALEVLGGVTDAGVTHFEEHGVAVPARRERDLPRSVNFTALASRFTRIWRAFTGSVLSLRLFRPPERVPFGVCGCGLSGSRLPASRSRSREESEPQASTHNWRIVRRNRLDVCASPEAA
jgi:hypothetical protein